AHGTLRISSSATSCCVLSGSEVEWVFRFRRQTDPFLKLRMRRSRSSSEVAAALVCK
ncbi:unnamed protein product, partial [Amoebophrya sp. A120]